MERAIRTDPLINIIPKVSTESALAFLRSQIGINRNPLNFKIMSDMNRENESPSNNAGARFIKECNQMGLTYDTLIFTSSEAKAKAVLEKEKVDPKSVQVTVATNDAVKFLTFA